MKRLVPLNNYSSSTAPSGVEGAMYFDTQSKRLKIYFDSQWYDLALSNDLTPTSIDGGTYNQSSFSNSYDGGYYNTNTFDVIIDGGVAA
jgi:hypothetical protein